MNAEQVKELSTTAIADLAAALQRGQSDQLTRYLAAMGRFHRYSVGNMILILCQCPAATHVGGFQTWKAQGRFVKKGEKGIAILAPMIRSTKADDAKADEPARDGNKPATRPGKLCGFRVVHVFDISQTDGTPLPDWNVANVQGDPSIYLDRLHSFIAACGIQHSIEAMPAGSYGVSRGRSISIAAGLSPAAAFSVTVHELAHELMHRSEDRPASLTVRETEAEAVAFVVCSAIGLDPGTAASDYIQMYDGTVETLTTSLDRIQRTASKILEAILAKPADRAA